jgi:hypothetical protein
MFTRIIRFAAIIIVALLLSVPFSAKVSNAAPARAEVGGSYKVVGVDTSNLVYHGTMDVEENGDVFTLSYDVGSSYPGVGLLNGNVFSVVVGPAKKCSIGSYTIDGGTLEGTWAILDTEGTGTETATADTAPEEGSIEGDWTVEGTNTAGKPFTATMSIEKDGSTYKFTRKEGKATLNGRGLKSGNVLAVTFGDKECAVINYDVIPDGSLSALWAKVNSKAIGLEDASVSIEGEYTASGTNPDGKTYKMNLTVDADGPVYNFTWKGTKSSDKGVAVRQTNTVASSLGGTKCNLFSFKRYSNGFMYGWWASQGSDKLGIEFATPKENSGDIEGEYEITGTDLEGKSYKGTLNITSDGDVYTLDWTFDDKTDTASGVLVKDVLAVVSGDKCGVVAYSIDAKKNMTGKWHLFNSDTVQNEKVVAK